MQRAEIRTAAKLDLADSTTWTDSELNRAVDQVTADISRLMPLEKYYEPTLREAVTLESFTSAAAGTAKALANKPIEPLSDTVYNSAATVTYTRDTDYSMDYSNGTITVISGGSMAGATAYKITYKRDRTAVNVSSLTDMIRPLRVETPIHNVPQTEAEFAWTGDILWLLTREGGSQARWADKDHVKIVYQAQHTAPTDTVAGTFPRFLDDVVVKGTSAYALFIEARRLNVQAVADAASARTRLTAAVTELTDVETALDALNIASTGPQAKLATALAAAITELTDVEVALDAINTGSTGPHAKIVAALTAAEFSAARAAAVAALDKVATFLALAGNAPLTTGAIKLANDDMALAATNIGTDAPGVWTEEVKHILSAAGIPNAEDFLLTMAGTPNAEDFLELGDDKINTVNLGSEVAQEYRQYASVTISMADIALRMAQLWDAKRKDFLTAAQTQLASAQQHLTASQQHVSQSQSHNAEGESRVSLANTYMAEADRWNAEGELYINEAMRRMDKANIRLAESDRWNAVGELYINEAMRRMEKANIHIGVAMRYIETIQQDYATAERFLADARERHQDYWSVLTSKTQQMYPGSTASRNQYR